VGSIVGVVGVGEAVGVVAVGVAVPADPRLRVLATAEPGPAAAALARLRPRSSPPGRAAPR
jgi:hypothetical protein